ncbi:hypothetical protein JTE90_022880 [Oedothorax gibbosus]|uniref:Uncharacterized protein n=1 Tax=Oedothorax gibbosus TaxID=931172 RepID=A0AAV6UT55_9ARAC|nr:hypothetical protein JTE90_022880 [Oedothorax gibbosus]
MDCDQRNKDGVDIRQRKFGLPTWMVNNMERLNYATDFEQYGSSPPETESFLPEHLGFPDAMHPMDRSGFEDYRTPTTKHSHHSEDLVRTALENKHLHPAFTNAKGSRVFESCPDSLVSSPDSTPCPTPEPSPVIRRKVSIPHPGDTVLTNPGRWFYFGKLKKSGPNSPMTNKESCEAVDAPTRGGVKLVISNFDLNAVSPNSW